MGLETLFIRTDASLAIGTGHVMRCLALAQAWQDNVGDVVFVMAQAFPALIERLRAEGFTVVCLNLTPGGAEDAAQFVGVAREHNARWTVVDGHHFQSAYQLAIKDAHLQLLCLDDMGEADHYLADLLLNQNLHAHASMYSKREPYTRLLLGTRYAMLRREFNPWREWERAIAPLARKLLVSMGGIDAPNVTAAVLESLPALKTDGLEIRVIVGPGNPHRRELEPFAAESSPSVRFLNSVTSMPDLIAWADVAISAGGSTCWELCFMGLPAILLDLAENQRVIAEELNRQQAAVYLGRGKDGFRNAGASTLERILRSQEERAALSKKARTLVDGLGAGRVIQALRH